MQKKCQSYSKELFYQQLFNIIKLTKQLLFMDAINNFEVVSNLQKNKLFLTKIYSLKLHSYCIQQSFSNFECSKVRCRDRRKFSDVFELFRNKLQFTDPSSHSFLFSNMLAVAISFVRKSHNPLQKHKCEKKFLSKNLSQ